MKKHRLLKYEQISQRYRAKLYWSTMALLAFGIYDQFSEVMGDAWHLLWIAFAAAALLWLYYAFLVRRASIQARPKHLRLQGPIHGINISYGRIHSVTAAAMGQHYPTDKLKRGERSLLKPFYRQTCVFIELRSCPRAFRWRRLWFPPWLFSVNRQGLVCHVDDWMALSRDMETARTRRQQRRDQRQEQAQSLAARVMAER